MVFASAGWIYEPQFDVIADVVEMAIAPDVKRVDGGRTAALLGRTIVGAACGVRIDFVGRPVKNVNPTAIGSPTGDARGEMLIGVSNAAIVLFAEGILWRIGIGIATAPEFFDVLFAFFVVGEAEKGRALIGSDDVGDFLVEPIGIGSAFFGELLGLLLAALRAFRPVWGGAAGLERMWGMRGRV